MPGEWSGRRATEMTARVLAVKGRKCALGLPGCTLVATTADHILPKSRGGAMWDMGNLQPACSHCNGSKGKGLSEGAPVALPEWLTD